MAVNLDESVIIRAMRLLLMHGIAPEPSPDAYHHIPDSLAYVSGTSHHFSEVTLGVQKTARLQLAIFQRDLGWLLSDRPFPALRLRTFRRLHAFEL